MIGLATQVRDPIGAVILGKTAESDLAQMGRRVSRTATLDGASVITDGGHAAADRTFDVVCRHVTQDDLDSVEYLIRNYSQIIVSTDRGCFVGALETMRLSEDKLTIKILVTEEIS